MEKIIKHVPMKDIIVSKTRFRKEFNNIESLAESIDTIGLLNPIIISEKNVLIAGERRFKAYQLLKKETIPAIIMNVDTLTEKIIEITENLEREDFNWHEKVIATKNLHEAYFAKYGKGWSERKTAEKSGISKSTISDDINLAECYLQNPEIFEGCKTKQQALKALKKFKVDEAMTELALRKKSASTAKKIRNMIHHGDCNVLIDKLPDKFVNSVISDPIFGMDVFENRFVGDTPKLTNVFDDTKETFFKTMKILIKKLDRVLKKDATFAIFCCILNFQFLKDEFQKIGFDVDQLPLIWVRSQNTSRSIRPEKYFNRTYDLIVYGTRGNACLTRQGLNNVISIGSLPFTQKDHPTEKPVELMEELITRLCLPGHVVLDPMCGSGSTLVACLRRSMFPVGFEINESYYNIAYTNLSRAMELKDANLQGG